MDEKHPITQIPLPGGSGKVPTGAMQFAGDWPGLFIRGDDAIGIASAIKHLRERLANHQDLVVTSSLHRLAKYQTVIERDVIVRHSDP